MLQAHNANELYKDAASAKEKMDGIVGGVVDGMKSEAKNVTLVKVRLKDTEDNGEPKEEKGVAYPRVREKMELKYAEKHPESTGAALVQDIIRMSIMCDNEHEMLEVLQRIKAHPDLRIARLKNLFIAKELDAPGLLAHLGGDAELAQGFAFLPHAFLGCDCTGHVHVTVAYDRGVHHVTLEVAPEMPHVFQLFAFVGSGACVGQ